MATMYHVEVEGDGVRALRAYLVKHLPQEMEGKDREWLLSDNTPNGMTTTEFRRAVELLQTLRQTTPNTPTLSSFLQKQAHVKPIAEVDPFTVATSKEQAMYLEKRREQLVRLDEEKRYGRLVKNVQKESTTGDIARFQKSVKQHLSIGANMVFARVTAFAVVYMIARTLTESETTRIIAGLGGAIVMMVIEMVLFITRAAKFEIIEQEQLNQKRSVF